MNQHAIDVVVGGATGLVGRTLCTVLEERRFPVRHLIPLASPRSAGTTVLFRGESLRVETLTEESLRGSHAALAFFSAGAAVSRSFSPVAVKCGMLVIDNSSAFRMDPNVPLVVPEVNPDEIASHRGIIANPNCSTIQLVVALKPLHDAFGIRRIVVATYQSVTGAGQRGVNQLMDELGGKEPLARKFPHPIAFNVFPQVDEFADDGYTKEEHKMVNETRKILGDEGIAVNATCVRVPSIGGHGEAVTVEFRRDFSLDAVRSILREAPGVKVVDNPGTAAYPMPRNSHNSDEVYVGRLRRDPSAHNSLALWIVADNIRKGAATNAVQIAEKWLEG